MNITEGLNYSHIIGQVVSMYLRVFYYITDLSLHTYTLYYFVNELL